MAVSFAVTVYAQSRPRSSIQAGMGIIIQHYQFENLSENHYDERYFGPAMTIGYDYRFAKNLSVFAWGSIGQIRHSENMIFTRDPSLPGVIKGTYSPGVVTNTERFNLGIACMFHPWPWLALGLGPYCEFLKSAYGSSFYHTISSTEIDPETGDNVILERIPYLHYLENRYFRYGIALPLQVQVYSNDKLAVSVSYRTCFFRSSSGKFRMGTNAAVVSLAVYL